MCFFLSVLVEFLLGRLVIVVFAVYEMNTASANAAQIPMD